MGVCKNGYCELDGWRILRDQIPWQASMGGAWNLPDTNQNAFAGGKPGLTGGTKHVAEGLLPSDGKQGQNAGNAQSNRNEPKAGTARGAGGSGSANGSGEVTGKGGGGQASAGVDGQDSAEDAGATSERCKTVLLDNIEKPADYPPVFKPAPYDEVVRRVAEDGTRFLSSHGATKDDYDIAASRGLTQAVTLQARSASPPHGLYLDGRAEDASQHVPAIEQFLSEGSTFFGYRAIRPNAASCTEMQCRYEFVQDYCGLKVERGPGATDQGTLAVAFQPDTLGIVQVQSSLVPLLPIPLNPLLAHDQLVEQVVGQTVHWSCADGTHSAVITEHDDFTFPEPPVVFLRASSCDDTGRAAQDAALEYRLAMNIVIGNEYVATVDAIDGTLLGIKPTIACD